MPRRTLLSRSPAFALAAAGLVMLSVVRFGFGGRAFIAAFFVAVLAVLSAIDIERRVLPNAIVLPAAALILGAQMALYPERALEWTASAFGACAFLFLVLAAYPRGLGMGDVKLALLLGAGLGSAIVLALLVGTLAAALAGIVLLVKHGPTARKMTIPLGPFLAFGAVVALFWGQPLLGT